MDSIFAEPESLQYPKGRTKQRFLIVLLVLVFTLTIRESGYLVANLTSERYETTASLENNSEAFMESAAFLSLTTQTKAFSTITENKSWRLAASARPNSNTFSDILELVSANLAKEGLEFSDLQTDLSGLYWIPLMKTGNCSYRIEFRGYDADLGYYKASLSGRVEFSIIGLSTVGEAKELIADQVGTNISKQMASARRP